MNENKTNEFKFTISKLEKLTIPIKGKKYFKDTEEKGLQLYVTPNGVKTFCYRKKVNGKSWIKTFGKFGEITIDTARKKCVQLKSEISKNPNYLEDVKELEQREVKEKVVKKLEDQIVEESVLEYISLYCERHKSEKTVKAEKRYLELYLKPIANRKAKSIEKIELIRLHSEITDKNGTYIANRVIAFVRSMYNWKIDNQEWPYGNPASRIKLNKETPRERYVKKSEKERFLEALDQEPNEIARDFFFVSILTGARRSNVLSMRWEQIDFDEEVWRIPKTKNKSSHTVPLIKEVIKILNIRKQRNPKIGFKDSLFVFPSNRSASGHLEEPKKFWKEILKRANINNLVIHDLRRTMGSYMTMYGSNLQTVQKALGHRSIASTLIYSKLDTKTMREAMQKAGVEILN